MQNNQISSKDLRLAPLMAQVAALTGEAHISCSVEMALDICSKYPDAEELSSNLKDTIETFRGMSLFEEITDVGRSLAKMTGNSDEVRTRNAEIFASRYGAVNLGERATLEILASRHGMTRERVRQIIDKMLSKLASKTLWMPACDEALASGSYMRLSENEIYAFSAFARDVLGTTVQVEKVKVRGRTVVNNPQVAEFTMGINTVSQRLISRNGAAQTYVTYAMASSMCADRTPLSFADFLEILSQTPDIVWLDQSTGWYAFGEDLKNAKRNRVRNHLLKMLACAPKAVDVEEAFAQLGRYRERGREDVGDTPFIFIQPSVLKALMHLMPEVAHAGFDDFSLRGNKEAAREELLSDVEKKVYALMASKGGVVSRAQVRKALVDTNQIGLPALTVTWERSPIFAAVERGICRIVGWDIDTRALESARCTVNG